MLRKNESESISKRLVLSVVICVLLQFFYFGLATALDDIPLDSSFMINVPGEPDFTSFMQATSDSTCEKCDDGCTFASDYLKLNEIREVFIGKSACIGPGTCPPGPHYDEICSNDPLYIGFSLDPDGPFTNSIVIETYRPAEGEPTNWYPYYIKGLEVTEALCSVTEVVNWEDGYCAYNGLPCCCIDWTVYPNEFAVVLEEYYSTLYQNPDWAGPGARIYPGKKTASDTVNRKTVKIKAYNAPCPNKNVYFAAVDIDDPSDSLIIDPNNTSGADNRYSSGKYIVGSGTVKADQYGYASWLFDVSMQPGDNFRFVATCDPDALGDGLVAMGPGSDVIDGYGNLLPQDYAKITQSLTVWRQLHIEVDSMGIVQDNHHAGTIKKVRRPHKDFTILDFEPKLNKKDRNRFENGTIWIKHPLDPDPNAFLAYQVKDNGLSSVSVLSTTVHPDVIDMDFNLYDDDDMFSQFEYKTGDENVDVPEPNTSIIKNSDYKEFNRFAPAYIKPVYDLENKDSTVPFVLNLADGDTSVYRFDNKSSHEDEAFWTAYLLGAYQGNTNEDGDPDKEKEHTLGWCDLYEGAVIFRETIVEKFSDGASTTAHELGHLFLSHHIEEGMLMQEKYPIFTEPNSYFSERTIRVIRGNLYP